jgi:hypothetical protein
MMGVVYEAYDTVLARTVALKTIQLAFVVTPAEQATFEQRFFVEARIAARLSHPGIVVVYDVGKDDATGLLFIVLEHLKGQTLAERTAGRRPLYWRDALQIAGKLAEALHHAHAHGVIHRDIKPANVLVVESGEPKIMDFGIATVETARIKMTTSGQSFGTPLYMSPEQALGRDVLPQSDLFSLGSILYTLLTGSAPFDAPGIPAILMRIAREAPLPPSFSVAGLPREVDAIVSRALAKRPSDRYPDGQTMSEDIEDVLNERRPRHTTAWAPPAPADADAVAPVATAPLLDIEELSGVLEPALDPIEELSALVDDPVPLAREPERHGVPAASAAPSRTAARSGVLVYAAAALLVVLAAYFVFHPPAVPASTAGGPAVAKAPDGTDVAAGAPTQLVVAFEHPIRAGTLRVWIDGQPALDRKFYGRERRVLALKQWAGTVKETIEVGPGTHAVKVEVVWDDNDRTEVSSAVFKAGIARGLDVSIGRLRKDLALSWR